MLKSCSSESKLELSKKGVATMARYEVKMLITFEGELEADSAEEAEQLAWTSWGDTMDREITYSGVDSIEVDEIEEDEEDEDE
jgi:hypothetical protein